MSDTVNTADIKGIPWRRIAAEGVAIVVSILLAFAIDAWWDSVGAQRHEARVLVGLRTDFEHVRREAARVRNGYERIVNGASELLSRTGPAGVPAAQRGQVDSLVSALLTGAPLFVPAQGTVAVLLNADGLKAISDLDLRSRLSEWPRHVANVQRAESNGHTLMLSSFMPYLYARVPVRSLDAISNPELGSNTSAFPLESSQLLTSLTFENLVNDRLFFASRAIEALQEADSAAAGIMASIERSLNGR